MASPVVAVDPLFDPPAGADAIVEMAHRYGRYRLYAEHERIEIDLGRGLMQRHDSVQAFLRTRRRPRAGDDADLKPPPPAPATSARSTPTAPRPHIGGVEAFLHHRALVDGAVAGARAAGGRAGDRLRQPDDPGPGAGGAHRRARVPRRQPQGRCRSGCSSSCTTRGCSTRGACTSPPASPGSRTATTASCATGPTGPTRRRVVAPGPGQHGARARHRQRLPRRRPGGARRRAARRCAPGAGLVADPTADGDRWTLSDADGAHVATYDWDELRFSVSWKAYCFADEAERDRLARPHRRPHHRGRGRPPGRRPASPARSSRPTCPSTATWASS